MLGGISRKISGRKIGRARDEATPGAISGEFACPALEAAFAAERRDDSQRQARLLMLASILLNTLFLASDWRFHGTPHFFVAIPARLTVIAASLACLTYLAPPRAPGRVTLAMVAWMTITGVAVSALVTSHSSIALFVVLLLPLIYYLTVPAPFAVVALGGMACSAAMFLGYGEYAASPATAGGLALALVMLNCALAITVGRANRLERLQWLATQSERRISAELAASRETLERMFAASPIPMVVTDRGTGRIIKANESLRRFAGGDPLDLEGTAEPYYLRPEDRALLIAEIDRCGRIENLETELRLPDGSVRTVLITANALMTPDGARVMAGIVDISDRKAVERSLEWLASTDTLTGLPNRGSFFATARMEMARAARSGQPLALLMADLDHFKRINDNWGHQTGDNALRAFAGVCLERLRDEDAIGRLGGEEFGILLPGCDAEAAMSAADRLRAALAEVTVSSPTLPGPRLTVSPGVTSILPSDADLDAAIARADRALYIAKRDGRNRAVFAPMAKAMHAAG